MRTITFDESKFCRNRTFRPHRQAIGATRRDKVKLIAFCIAAIAGAGAFSIALLCVYILITEKGAFVSVLIGMAVMALWFWLFDWAMKVLGKKEGS